MTSKKKISCKKILKSLSKNYWVVSTILLAVLLVGILTTSGIGGSVGSSISREVVGQKVLEFANNQGANATLVNVSDDGQFYEVILSIQGQELPVYATKDGENLITQLIPLTAKVTAPTQTPTPAKVPKSDRPTVDLFVMSFCPYGNRGEDTLLPVYELLKDKVDWKINYIVSVSGDKVNSLHGQPEVDQDIREVCVKEEYGLDKFWKFINYVNQNRGRDGSCWEEGSNELGLDKNKIQSCFENKGLEIMKKEAEISRAAGAQGSPTMIINGAKTNVVYQYENSEAYKEAICSAFNEAPKECSQALGSTTSTSAGGSC